MTLKFMLIIIGSLSLALGLIGAFIPGLPTTPFILLTTACYLKSSPALTRKLSRNRFAIYYMNALEDGTTRRIKIYAISIMWIMILISSFLVIQDWKWRILLFIVGIIGTIFKIYLPEKSNKLFANNSIMKDHEIQKTNEIAEGQGFWYEGKSKK